MFEKEIMLLKVTSEGQKKSGFELMASQKDRIGDPPSEFRKDLWLYYKAILHRSDRFASCILLRV